MASDSVLIALADVGPGVQLEETLAAAGVRATWDQGLANGPPSGGGAWSVVLVDADHLGGRLAAVCDAWRDHASVPGVVAIGSSVEARAQAPHARVTLVAPTAKLATIISCGTIAAAVIPEFTKVFTSSKSPVPAATARGR